MACYILSIEISTYLLLYAHINIKWKSPNRSLFVKCVRCNMSTQASKLYMCTVGSQFIWPGCVHWKCPKVIESICLSLLIVGLFLSSSNVLPLYIRFAKDSNILFFFHSRIILFFFSIHSKYFAILWSSQVK